MQKPGRTIHKGEIKLDPKSAGPVFNRISRELALSGLMGNDRKLNFTAAALAVALDSVPDEKPFAIETLIKAGADEVSKAFQILLSAHVIDDLSPIPFTNLYKQLFSPEPAGKDAKDDAVHAPSPPEEEIHTEPIKPLVQGPATSAEKVQEEPPKPVEEAPEIQPEPQLTREKRAKTAISAIGILIKEKLGIIIENESEIEKLIKQFIHHASASVRANLEKLEESRPGFIPEELLLERTKAVFIAYNDPADIRTVFEYEKSYFGLADEKEFYYHVERRIRLVDNEGKNLWKALFDIGVDFKTRVAIFRGLNASQCNEAMARVRLLRELGDEQASKLIIGMSLELLTNKDIFTAKMKELKKTEVEVKPEQALLSIREENGRKEIAELLRVELSSVCTPEELEMITKNVLSRALTPRIRNLQLQEGVLVLEELVLQRLKDYLSIALPERAKSKILQNAGIFGMNLPYKNFFEEEKKLSGSEKSPKTTEEELSFLLTDIGVNEKVREKIIKSLSNDEDFRIAIGWVQQLIANQGDSWTARFLEHFGLNIKDEESFISDISKYDYIRKILIRISIPGSMTPERISEVINILSMSPYPTPFMRWFENVDKLSENAKGIQCIATLQLHELFPGYGRQTASAPSVPASSPKPSPDEPLTETIQKPKEAGEEMRNKLKRETKEGLQGILDGLVNDNLIEQICEQPDAEEKISKIQKSLGSEAIKSAPTTLRLKTALTGPIEELNDVVIQTKRDMIKKELENTGLSPENCTAMAERFAHIEEASLSQIIAHIKELSDKATGLGPDFVSVIERHPNRVRLFTDLRYYASEKIDMMIKRRGRVSELERRISRLFGDKISGVSMLLRRMPSSDLISKLDDLDLEFRHDMKLGVFNGYDALVLEKDLIELKAILKTTIANRDKMAAEAANITESKIDEAKKHDKLVSLLGYEGAVRAINRDESMLELHDEGFLQALLIQVYAEAGIDMRSKEMEARSLGDISANVSLSRWKTLVEYFGQKGAKKILNKDPFALVRAETEFSELVELQRSMGQLAENLNSIGVDPLAMENIRKTCSDPEQAKKNVKDILYALDENQEDAAKLISDRPDIVLANEDELLTILIKVIEDRKQKEPKQDVQPSAIVPGKVEKAKSTPPKPSQEELAIAWKEVLGNLGKSEQRKAIARLMSKKGIRVPSDTKNIIRLIERFNSELKKEEGVKGCADAAKAYFSEDSILERIIESTVLPDDVQKAIRKMGVDPGRIIFAIIKAWNYRFENNQRILTQKSSVREQTLLHNLTKDNRMTAHQASELVDALGSLDLTVKQKNSSPTVYDFKIGPMNPIGEKILKTIDARFIALCGNGD